MRIIQCTSCCLFSPMGWEHHKLPCDCRESLPLPWTSLLTTSGMRRLRKDFRVYQSTNEEEMPGRLFRIFVWHEIWDSADGFRKASFPSFLLWLRAPNVARQRFENVTRAKRWKWKAVFYMAEVTTTRVDIVIIQINKFIHTRQTAVRKYQRSH